MTDPNHYEHAFSALNCRKYISLTEKKAMLTYLCQFKYESLLSVQSYIAILEPSNERYWTEAYTAAHLAEDENAGESKTTRSSLNYQRLSGCGFRI